MKLGEKTSWDNHFYQVSWGSDKKCRFFTNSQLLIESHFFDPVICLVLINKDQKWSSKQRGSWHRFNGFGKTHHFSEMGPKTHNFWGNSIGIPNFDAAKINSFDIINDARTKYLHQYVPKSFQNEYRSSLNSKLGDHKYADHIPFAHCVIFWLGMTYEWTKNFLR